MNYSHPKLYAFNIGWYEQLAREIYSYIQPEGYLLHGDATHQKIEKFYPNLL
ncbi:hypothetical protein [Acinetobacter courvalinii]|uniref:hypothetical protein n=1 Tax=Acinetobacter courvalinii TaxID=280147 RepID=UPI0021D09FBD|nr:hypothetical protein [Acinetobacter courvalinii]